LIGIEKDETQRKRYGFPVCCSNNGRHWLFVKLDIRSGENARAKKSKDTMGECHIFTLEREGFGTRPSKSFNLLENISDWLKYDIEHEGNEDRKVRIHQVMTTDKNFKEYNQNEDMRYKYAISD
jgi:hypothetical protein